MFFCVRFCCCCFVFIFLLFFLFLKKKVFHCPALAENSGRLTWLRHRSRKSSAATRFYWWVQYFRVSKQLYDCKCLGFLRCAQIGYWYMHLHAHGGCTDTVKRESVLEVDSRTEKNALSHRGLNLNKSLLFISRQSIKMKHFLSHMGPRSYI